jgi:hypothetical protein
VVANHGCSDPPCIHYGHPEHCGFSSMATSLEPQTHRYRGSTVFWSRLSVSLFTAGTLSSAFVFLRPSTHLVPNKCILNKRMRGKEAEGLSDLSCLEKKFI